MMSARNLRAGPPAVSFRRFELSDASLSRLTSRDRTCTSSLCRNTTVPRNQYASKVWLRTSTDDQSQVLCRLRSGHGVVIAAAVC